jgi:hypothetical protein
MYVYMYVYLTCLLFKAYINRREFYLFDVIIGYFNRAIEPLLACSIGSVLLAGVGAVGYGYLSVKHAPAARYRNIQARIIYCNCSKISTLSRSNFMVLVLKVSTYLTFVRRSFIAHVLTADSFYIRFCVLLETSTELFS